MIYKSSPDNFVRVITILTLLLFSYLIYTGTNILLNPSVSSGSALLYILMIALLLSILIYCYLYVPTSYILNEKEIQIKRRLKPMQIPFQSLAGVSELSDKEMKGTLRVMGVGGLLGYFGKFRNDKLGDFKLYSRRRSHYILLQLHSGKKIVLAPDQPAMYEEIAQKLKLSRT